MITKFDSLYAGHVDLDDIGYGGADIVTLGLFKTRSSLECVANFVIP